MQAFAHRRPATARILAHVQQRPFASAPVVCARGMTHYEELGVGPGASRKEIQSKFYELSKVYHPDAPSTSTSGSLESRTARFQAISQSYSILSDDTARKQYDQTVSGSFGRRPGYTSGGGHEAGGRSGFGGGSSANWSSSADNDARRERANYAWSHPRRSTNSTSSSATQQAGRAEPVRNRPGNGPTTASEDLFSRFAAQEQRSRARQAANRYHTSKVQHFGQTGTEAFGEKAEEESRLINESGVKRSGSVVLVFGTTLLIAAFFSDRRDSRSQLSK